MSGARIACADDPVGGPLPTVQASSRRCLFGRLACLLPTVPGNGWAEVITLAAVFVIAALSTPGASPARCCCCRFRSASWARPVRRSPGQPAVQRRLHSRPCTGTGGNVRPAAAWPWCSSPGRCPAPSPDRNPRQGAAGAARGRPGGGGRAPAAGCLAGSDPAVPFQPFGWQGGGRSRRSG